MNPVFVTGGTGYLGRPLIEALIAKRFDVRALVRPGSEAKLPAGPRAVPGDALEADSFADRIPADATIVHLVGTPHPSPAKAAEFQRVDLASIRATTTAAIRARAGHLVYVSAAHPAPVMKAYIAVRVAGEALVSATGIPATILRPWYVLGPGHRWPYALVPFYALFRALPTTREGARRLGLVTRSAMVAALVHAVESAPARGIRLVEVPEIQAGFAPGSSGA
jgi:nucleoside-diphosphate-sugar epimerase